MRSRKILWAAAALCAAALAARQFNSGPATAVAAANTATVGVPVKVVSATRGDVDITLKVVAHAEAWSSVMVCARVSGQIDSLAFTPGAKIRKGDVLAQIDARPFRAQLDQTRGSVASARAQLGKAETDLQRYSAVLAKGFVSKADYDSYKANVDLARAAVQTQQAALELAQLQLDYTRIVAPFDGVVGAPLIFPGAQVAASATDIVSLNEIKPIHIVFHIPEGSLDALLELRMHGPVEITARLPDNHASLQGVLDFIDNSVDRTTGTIALKGRFDNDDAALVPGQFVEASVPTQHLKDAISVPAETLQTSDKGAFVFVVDADGKARQRFVEPGPSADGRTVITKGLAASERVVTDGQLSLTEGSVVRIAGSG